MQQTADQSRHKCVSSIQQTSGVRVALSSYVLNVFTSVICILTGRQQIPGIRQQAGSGNSQRSKVNKVASTMQHAASGGRK